MQRTVAIGILILGIGTFGASIELQDKFLAVCGLLAVLAAGFINRTRRDNGQFDTFDDDDCDFD